MPFKKFNPIKLGDSGMVVAKVCELLRKYGSTVKVTEDYHIGVYSAVKKFQKNNGFEVTGIVDKKTWDKLNMPLPVKRKAKKAAK